MEVELWWITDVKSFKTSHLFGWYALDKRLRIIVALIITDGSLTTRGVIKEI